MLGLSALSIGIKSIDGITDPEKVKENFGSIIAGLVAVGVTPTISADIGSLGDMPQLNTTLPNLAPAQGTSLAIK